MHLRLFLVSSSLALVSCVESTFCTADLRTGVTPVDTTIGIRDQFTIRPSILGCSGTKVLTDDLTWNSAAPTVAVVDTHGVVTAVQAGSATITVVGRMHGPIGQTHVTVR